MGFVYHGRMVEYLEIARTDLVRAAGLPYSEVEARGVWMPVAELTIKYIRPAHYDDVLTLRTVVREKPMATFRFESEISREDGTLIAKATVVLAFIDATRKRPMRVPDFIAAAVEENWGKELA
jgi:acyl-CoA thioester hydrolase